MKIATPTSTAVGAPKASTAKRPANATVQPMIQWRRVRPPGSKRPNTGGPKSVAIEAASSTWPLCTNVYPCLSTNSGASQRPRKVMNEAYVTVPKMRYCPNKKLQKRPLFSRKLRSVASLLVILLGAIVIAGTMYSLKLSYVIFILSEEGGFVAFPKFIQVDKSTIEEEKLYPIPNVIPLCGSDEVCSSFLSKLPPRGYPLFPRESWGERCVVGKRRNVISETTFSETFNDRSPRLSSVSAKNYSGRHSVFLEAFTFPTLNSQIGALSYPHGHFGNGSAFCGGISRSSGENQPVTHIASLTTVNENLEASNNNGSPSKYSRPYSRPIAPPIIRRGLTWFATGIVNLLLADHCAVLAVDRKRRRLANYIW